MADSPDASFHQVDSRGVVVKESPKLDLDLYIQNYKGRTRFERLFLIGCSSAVLRVDALKAAILEAKKGKDLQRYHDAVKCLHAVAPSEPEATVDKAWVDHVESSNKAETNRLEAELKGYKNNLIKESIRMGNEDLGKHYEALGDLGKAMDAYARMRPDVSAPKHIVDVGKHLMRVSIQRREWTLAAASLSKMTGAQCAEEEGTLQPYLKVSNGIALLGQGKYHEAALSFLATNYGIPITAANSYNDIASPNDVAIYGGLLALASMDRKDLQSKVLDNPNFRSFLELEPHIRRAVTQFVNGRYSACLAILDSYRPDYLLDVYLQPHVPKIYAGIRRKCIVQYLIPFSCVTLESMNEAFATPGESIEGELVKMIREGRLHARINTVDKVITTVATNPRSQMQSAALDAARSYEKEAIERIRWMSIAAAELEVRGPKHLPHSQPVLAQAMDTDDAPAT